MKPDDIPQVILDQVRGFMSKHDVYIGINAEHDMAMMILQARSKAYEECAKIADGISAQYQDRIEKLPESHYKVSYRLHSKYACEEVAQAIRQHSQKGEDNGTL